MDVVLRPLHSPGASPPRTAGGAASARHAAALRVAVGPAVAGLVLGLGGDVRAGLLGAALLAVTARWGTTDRDAIAALPLARVLVPVLGALAALVAVAAAGGTGLVGAVPVPSLALAAAVVLALDLLAATVRRLRPFRVLVIGTREEAEELAATLATAGGGRHRIVATTDELLGLEDALGAACADLVVHTDHLPASAVRGALAHRLRHGGPSVLHRDRFCELAFGVVPLDAVDEDWLLRLAEPGRRRSAGAGSRVLDVVVSATLLLLVLPLLLVLAPLIAADRDGGVLFRQRRVGRHGRPFTIIKLRTMRGTGSDWSGPRDPRVTRVGAVLRRTHVDELPQLWNVLRGDMALVGPRPEQVAIAERLGDVLPLFPYRHLVRPGITGWARVRAGYAASTEASAVKLGNDLFYLGHRSAALDVAILLETLRLTLFERQYDVDPPAAHIVLGRPAGPTRSTGSGRVVPGRAPAWAA
jgi:lipopolysaccharide/colanic/teichoic acid biosynthesis glycosyltransferase